MNIVVVNGYQEMSEKAAAFIDGKIKDNPYIKLGLATGGTPLGTYKNLIKGFVENRTSYKHVTTFNLDEYVGLSQENQNSYYYYMNTAFFSHIDIKRENIHIPKGDARDLQKECEQYEASITESGGIDLQLLGLGSNGHIGFNEPGSPFTSKTRVVNLEPSTIKANARFFENDEDVPTRAISMGISTIMNSKEILLLVSGEKKRRAFKQLLNGEILESFPASILKKHPCVTVIVDSEATGYEYC